jgi:hypothetical protein
MRALRRHRPRELASRAAVVTIVRVATVRIAVVLVRRSPLWSGDLIACPPHGAAEGCRTTPDENVRRTASRECGVNTVCTHSER